MDRLNAKQRAQVAKMSSYRLFAKLAQEGARVEVLDLMDREQLIEAWAKLFATGKGVVTTPAVAATSGATALMWEGLAYEERRFAADLEQRRAYAAAALDAHRERIAAYVAAFEANDARRDIEANERRQAAANAAEMDIAGVNNTKNVVRLAELNFVDLNVGGDDNTVWSALIDNDSEVDIVSRERVVALAMPYRSMGSIMVPQMSGPPIKAELITLSLRIAKTPPCGVNRTEYFYTTAACCSQMAHDMILRTPTVRLLIDRYNNESRDT